jgi:outer membrane murein-binding lipoprotein Lpp
MEKPPMTTNNSSDRGFGYRFGRALGRFLLALFKTLLILLVVGGLAAAIYSGYLLATQGGTNQAWINILRDDIDESRDRERELQTQLNATESQMATLEAQIGHLETAMSEEMATMEGAMGDMETQLSSLTRFGQTMSETVMTLDGDLAVLQGEIEAEMGTMSSEVTTLQADTDGLRDDLNTLQGDVSAIPEVDVVRLEELLLLFRVGETISRARLHLAEGNAGLALEQVNVGLALVNGMIADERFDAAALTPLQERLRLAQAALPGDTLLASRDLENGWAALDARLTNLLGLVLPDGAATAPLLNPTTTPEPVTATPVPVVITPTLVTLTPTLSLPTFTPLPTDIPPTSTPVP